MCKGANRCVGHACVLQTDAAVGVEDQAPLREDLAFAGDEHRLSALTDREFAGVLRME